MEYVSKEEFEDLKERFNALVEELSYCDLKRSVSFERLLEDDPFRFDEDISDESEDKVEHNKLEEPDIL